MLIVPQEFNRNAKTVREHDTPAETGRMLIEYMCERIGIPDLTGRDLLDHGCGVRFSESFLNLDLPLGSYTGLDVHRPLIEFLQEAVDDPRFAYHHVNVANRMYNRKGQTEAPYDSVDLGGRRFDIVSMFSVITHQDPPEAALTFAFLRRHIREGGHLFFSAFLHEDDTPFQQLVPEKPDLKASYRLDHLTGILERTGWEVLSVVDPTPRDLPIMSSLLCRPI
ncbi:class I SAM-dependent methyltransferase [Thalassococcus sp. BH17M4-6]|uniref:class I SAM-dependent methyltransferase n=1 Tax=Thalassococcus sp. BH17M4-6 TaxID=3413148 RepID=UPI003BE2647D